MNLETALEVLQNVNSVCPTCKSKGLIKEGANTVICKDCGGKGYKTFEELLGEIKESRESKEAGKE